MTPSNERTRSAGSTPPKANARSPNKPVSYERRSAVRRYRPQLQRVGNCRYGRRATYAILTFAENPLAWSKACADGCF
jgi:hypothetical protein